MGFGGSSLSYFAPPYSGPPPSSSSSTLSPLAPPFTVDRIAPRPSFPYDPYVPPWPLRPHSSDNCPHLQPPYPSPPPGSPPSPAYEASIAPDAHPYFGLSGPPAVSLARVSSGETSSRRGSNLAQVEPYYPQFGAIAVTSGADTPVFYGDRRESGSGYLSGFDTGTQAEGIGGSSMWAGHESMAVDSDHGVAFPQDTPTAQGFVAYENLQGGWHGELIESSSGKDHLQYEHLDWSDTGRSAGVPSDLPGPSALAPNASVGMCFSHSSDVLAFMEGSKTFDSNFLYDRYICETNVEGTDPMTFYPVTTYFPAKTFTSSCSTSASIDNGTLKNVNSHMQHVDAYKYNKLHRGHVSVRPREPSIDLNFEYKEGYAEANRAASTRKSDNANVGSDSVKITSLLGTRISHDYSVEKKSESRIAKLSISGSVECEPEQSSSEVLDESLAVDSPCWKGAPSARHSASGTFDTEFDISHLADHKINDPCKRGPDYTTVENEEVAPQLSGLRKERNIVMPSKGHIDDFEPKNENVVQALKQENCSTSSANVSVTGIANHCTDAVPMQGDSKDPLSPASKAVTNVSDGRFVPHVNFDLPSKAPTPGVDVQLLVKTIHNLSELLLSTCRLDANLLKEHDKELLRSAVNNLDVGVSRKAESGKMTPEPFCSGRDPQQELSSFSQGSLKGRFQATGSKSKDVNMDQRNSTSPHSGQEKMHSLPEKVLSENLFKQGENPEATFYENIWFEVEDAISSLKYKLQVLRSNIVDNCQQRLAKDAQQETSNMLKLSIQNSTNSLVGESRPPSITESPSKNPSSVVNYEDVSSSLEPQQMISCSIDNKVDEVDASVMARFHILKGRNGKLNFLDMEEKHGQLKTRNAVSNLGTHENIWDPCWSDGKLHSEVKVQPAWDAMTVGWGQQQLFHNGRTDDEVGGRNSAQYHDANYTQDLFLNTHFSEHRVAEGFCVQGAGGLVNQSGVPEGRSGKHFMTGLRDGSSDWEHVLKEELTW